MIIPKQLMNQRFIKVDNEKRPFEKNWQINANYSYDDKSFNQWININNRYGVLCGINNLIVLDFDNAELQEEVLNSGLLPETFTVKTARKGLYHLYFYTDNTDSWKILNKDKDTLCDIQGNGKQVIGAGTIIPDGRKYEIVHNCSIATVNSSLLHKILDKYDFKFQEKQMGTVANRVDKSLQMIKEKYKISELLSSNGIDTSINPTKCPFHSSKGGKCLSFDDSKGVFYCFHCEAKGDVINLYKQINNLDFAIAKKELCDKLGIEDNYNKNRLKNMSEKIKKKLASSFNMIDIIKDFINDNPVFYDKNNLWWLWDENSSVWFQVDETDLLVLLFNGDYNIPELQSINVQREFISNLKIISRNNSPKNPPLNWIQFGNKVYDINNSNEFSATSEYFFTNSLPFTPSEDPTTPIMDKLFIDWVGIENVDLLYQIIAYCCYRDYPIHHLFCFVGSGSNGKSSYLQIINNFIGQGNCTSVSLDSLMNSRFEIACLYKKLVCMMGETNFSTISRTEVLKKLTGQDLINFEFKNKNPFSDRNYSKILISTNTLPETTDKTDGFYRRWVTIDFPNKFNGQVDVLKYIPEYEYNNLSRKIVNILPKLLDSRTFRNIGTLEERKTVYENKSNPLPKFIFDNVDTDIDGFIPKWEFKKRYNDYLVQNNLRQRSDTEIGIKMKELGYEDKRVFVSDDKRVLVWVGMKWKEHKIIINNEMFTT